MTSGRALKTAELRRQVLNLDLVPLSGSLAEQVYTLIVDLTDAGQVYSAVMSHFQLSEPLRSQYKSYLMR